MSFLMRLLIDLNNIYGSRQPLFSLLMEYPLVIKSRCTSPISNPSLTGPTVSDFVGCLRISQVKR